MKIKKTTLYFLVILVIVVAGYITMASKSAPSSGSVSNSGNGDMQKVVIGMKNYNYYPNTIRVKVGQPVEISLDESVYGCFRDFTIREFGVRKYLKTPQDTVTFTPTEKGSYTFACSMGMGTGTLVVE